MRVYYVSPSILPSPTANSVHVVMQARALADAGVNVTVFAARSVANPADLPAAIRKQYGVSPDGIRCITSLARGRGNHTRIALLACWTLLRAERPDLIVSRNLLASFVIGVILGRPLIFEIHELEPGIRKHMQRLTMRRSLVTTAVISESLASCLLQHHGVGPRRTVVLRDAAPAGLEPVPVSRRRLELTDLIRRDLRGDVVCGYFGQLHPGRGIEIIEGMAAARPCGEFFVFGGNEADVQRFRMSNRLQNLHFFGHVEHPFAQEAMRRMDVLLMPYQPKVSIGVGERDTGLWMSPMKMFEYMASGVPIISSRLPSLCEVLRDRENALLVEPGAVTEWSAALDRLVRNPEEARAMAARAYTEYSEHHTWVIRARRILQVRST